MKIKIEFDTDLNHSFASFGASEYDIVCNVLDHIKEQVVGIDLDTYNIICKDGYSAIGMFSVEAK